MALKYICFDNGMFDEIVVFTDNNDHGNMCFRLGIEETDVISAGFVAYTDDGKPYCYGNSHSLKVPSREEDTELLLRFMKR